MEDLRIRYHHTRPMGTFSFDVERHPQGAVLGRFFLMKFNENEVKLMICKSEVERNEWNGHRECINRRWHNGGNKLCNRLPKEEAPPNRPLSESHHGKETL